MKLKELAKTFDPKLHFTIAVYDDKDRWIATVGSGWLSDNAEYKVLEIRPDYHHDSKGIEIKVLKKQEETTV
jgi:hypothetical protein